MGENQRAEESGADNAPAPLPAWAVDSHKGDHGHVLVIGGSVGLAGAPLLAAEAALLLGAGRVSLAVPEAIYGVVAAGSPELMVMPLAATQSGHLSAAAWPVLRGLLDAADAILVGPGLGRNPRTAVLVQRLLSVFDGPAVVDADALLALHHLPPKDTRIFTPHQGEAARLLGIRPSDVNDDRRSIVERLYLLLQGTVVLKGRGTLIRCRAGIWRNTTGKPALGRGGSGDVLAGMIAALAGQGLECSRAAATGVYLHGLVADRLALETGDRGLHPKRLLHGLPAVVREWEAKP